MDQITIMEKPRFHTIFFLILICLTFSPLVIPAGVNGPWFMGMPRTLWAGILVSISLLILTLITALRLAREEEHKKKD